MDEMICKMILRASNEGGAGGPCPAGEVHPWARKAVGCLHDANREGSTVITREQAVEAILTMIPAEDMKRKGGDAGVEDEIIRLIESIWDKVEGAATERIPSAQRVNDATLLAFIAKAPRFDLPAPRAGDAAIRAALSTLWQPGELITMGAARDRAATSSLEKWLEQPNLSRLEYLVPQEATAKRGLSSSGRPSRRCNAMFSNPRRYLAVECDPKGPGDPLSDKVLQVQLHARLSWIFPLVMLVDSGGKSIHGWYFVEGLPDDAVESFMRLSQQLGADKSVFTKCQWVRLPGGTREPKDPTSPRIAQPMLFLASSVQQAAEQFGDAHYSAEALQNAQNELLGAKLAPAPKTAQAPQTPQVPPDASRGRPAPETAPTPESAPSEAPEPGRPLQKLAPQPRRTEDWAVWGSKDPEVLVDWRALVGKVRQEILPKCYFINDSRGGAWAHTSDNDGVREFRQVKDFDAYLKTLCFKLGLDIRQAQALTIDGVSPTERFRLEIQRVHTVGFLGDVAGYPPGYYPNDERSPCVGHAALIINGPKEVMPVEGLYPTIQLIRDGVLGAVPEDRQVELFEGVLRHYALSRESRRRMPMLCLDLIGEPGVGKTFLGNILTQLFGGRCGDPSTFLDGTTNFNAGLISKEVWLINEIRPHRDNDPARFEERLKDALTGSTVRAEDKGKSSREVRPITLVVRTGNPDSHGVCTISDKESYEGKLMRLTVDPLQIDIPNSTAKEQIALDARIRAELPAYLHHLLSTTTAADIADKRFGVKSRVDSKIAEQGFLDAGVDQLMELLVRSRQGSVNYDVASGTATPKHSLTVETRTIAGWRIELQQCEATSRSVPEMWKRGRGQAFGAVMRAAASRPELTGVTLQRKGEYGTPVTVDWVIAERFVGSLS